jgi:hypothetical protein
MRASMTDHGPRRQSAAGPHDAIALMTGMACVADVLVAARIFG